MPYTIRRSRRLGEVAFEDFEQNAEHNNDCDEDIYHKHDYHHPCKRPAL